MCAQSDGRAVDKSTAVAEPRGRCQQLCRLVTDEMGMDVILHKAVVAASSKTNLAAAHTTAPALPPAAHSPCTQHSAAHSAAASASWHAKSSKAPCRCTSCPLAARGGLHNLSAPSITEHRLFLGPTTCIHPCAAAIAAEGNTRAQPCCSLHSKRQGARVHIHGNQCIAFSAWQQTVRAGPGATYLSRSARCCATSALA